jgi:hypothetical protein
MEKKSKSSLNIKNMAELEAYQDRLNLMAKTMEQTANWWSPRITKIAEKIQKLNQDEKFENEGLMADLQLKLNHLIKKSEWEQKEKVKEFNRVREKLIYSNLASSLSTKIPAPSGQFSKI